MPISTLYLLIPEWLTWLIQAMIDHRLHLEYRHSAVIVDFLTLLHDFALLKSCVPLVSAGRKQCSPPQHQDPANKWVKLLTIPRVCGSQNTLNSLTIYNENGFTLMFKASL